jgi:hypothetical protein
MLPDCRTPMTHGFLPGLGYNRTSGSLPFQRKRTGAVQEDPMIAIQDMLPDDVDEQQEIQRLLREQPDLQVMIEKAQAKAREMFPNPRFVLEPVRYGDEWDPPLQMIVHAELDRDQYRALLIQFMRWLADDLKYDSDRLLITAQRAASTIESP